MGHRCVVSFSRLGLLSIFRGFLARLSFSLALYHHPLFLFIPVLQYRHDYRYDDYRTIMHLQYLLCSAFLSRHRGRIARFVPSFLLLGIDLKVEVSWAS